MSNELIQREADVISDSAISDDSLIAVAEKAEQRIEAVNKIKRLALKVTNPQDWIDQNGKPYLQASGAEKVARLFGISWRIGEPVYEELEDGYFSYTYKGEFTLGNTTIEVIGSRSSKDGFFRKYDKDRKPLPPSEIDKGDVKKSAFTNLLANGITRLLGLRNLTWEDLKEAGINKEQTASVEYKDSKKEMLSEAHKKLFNLLNDYFKGDKIKMQDALKELTEFKDSKGNLHEGKTSIYDLSEKIASVAYGKLKKVIEQDKGMKTEASEDI